MSNKQEVAFDYTGSSFDSFLEEEGILDEVEAVAVERIAGWLESGKGTTESPRTERI